MSTEVKRQGQSLYELDYFHWLEQTVAQLKSRDFSALDLDNLVEELESLGRSEKRAIASYLMRLCEHLLKLSYWDAERNDNGRGWTQEILNVRIQIQGELEDSPSLKPFLDSIFIKQYQNARKLFLNARGVAGDRVPLEPYFSLDQALDEQWLP